jgi:hypothetical protein
MLRNLKLFILLPLAAAALAQAPASAKDYKDVVDGCRANITREQLSPKKAEECVKDFHDDPAILERLKEENPGEAGDILAYNSALKDYKKTLVSYKDAALLWQYDRIMGGNKACPLCKLGLGPLPEDSFKWAEKYIPEDTPEFKYSARTWDVIGDIRTGMLQTKGWNRNTWNAMELMDRYATLQGMARDVVAVTTGVPVAMYPDKAKLAKLIPVLKEDLLDPQVSAQLDAYLKGAGVKPVKTGPTPSEKAGVKISKMSGDLGVLKNMGTGEQAAKLDDFFNGTGHRQGDDFAFRKTGKTPVKPYVYKALSPDDVNALGARLLKQGADGTLSGPLATEIKGTKAGDEILAFYKDKGFQKSGTNKLAFGFEQQKKGQFGGWNWYREDIKINSLLVNDWMQKNKVTPEMLMAGDPATNKYLRGLSEYLAPTFVHEATHQRQTAKDKARGIDLFKYKGKSNSYYQMEKETEAFSMDASFTAEKFSKLPKEQRDAYLERLDPFDKRNSEIFQKQGVDGVRLSNHKAYSDKESLDGEASRQFVLAKDTAMRLEALKARNPDSLNAAERAEMQALRQEMDSKYKWYTCTMQDSVAAEDKINLWRQGIMRQISGNKTIKESPPPTLLSP